LMLSRCQRLRIAILISVVGSCSCSPALWNLAADSPRSATAVPESGQLMLFGGSGHRTFLGCLSCSQYSAESVFNTYGRFGSRYQTNSIWNSYSIYGSKYSEYSACNPYATDPPVVVDEYGNYYGRLTVNAYSSERYGSGAVMDWLRQDVCDE